jgi:methionyl-tRNA formyltransferase
MLCVISDLSKRGGFSIRRRRGREDLFSSDEPDQAIGERRDRYLKYVLFGDESTLPRMRECIGASAALSVIASNRPQALQAVDGMTVIQPAKRAAGRAEFIAALRAAAADAFFCFSYSMILDDELLAIPKLGAINIHGGLLPSYRGANILNWVLVEGATSTGVTAHYMSGAIDEGDVIYSRTTPIIESDTARTLKDRLDCMGFDILARIYWELEAGEKLPRTAQDASKANYYRRRRPEDGSIDWATMSDRQVFNLIRALVSPWPGAYTIASDGSRVIFDRYRSIEEVAALRDQYAPSTAMTAFKQAGSVEQR